MLRDRLKRLEQRAAEFVASTYACEQCQDGDLGAVITIDAPDGVYPLGESYIYDAQGRCRNCGTEAGNRINVRVLGPRRSKELAPC
jgi:hypothetical protein